MCFILSFSLQKQDSSEAENSIRETITAKDSETHHIVPPPAQPGAPPVKGEAKEPAGPSVKPATSVQASPKPTERTASALQPQSPVSKPEPGLQPSRKPHQEGADEEKPAEVSAGGQEGLVNSEEPVCEVEKQLWATVEETAAEGGKQQSERAEEEEEEEEKEQEGGVIGG